MFTKPKKKIERQEISEEQLEDLEEEPEEEVYEEEEVPRPSNFPIKKVQKPIQQQRVQEEEGKPTLNEVLLNHESRLQAIESVLFRIKGSI